MEYAESVIEVQIKNEKQKQLAICSPDSFAEFTSQSGGGEEEKRNTYIWKIYTSYREKPL